MSNLESSLLSNLNYLTFYPRYVDDSFLIVKNYENPEN